MQGAIVFDDDNLVSAWIILTVRCGVQYASRIAGRTLVVASDDQQHE